MQICMFAYVMPMDNQPMDNGVIRSLKSRYRKRLARNRLRAFEAGRDDNITLLDALHMLRSSWDEIDADLIRNCYAAVGFCKEPVIVDEVDVTWSVCLFSCWRMR